MPVLSTSESRVSFLCPQLPPGAPIQVSLETSSGQSQPLTATMRDATPGIFTIDGSGKGQGVILVQDTGTLATVRNPWVSGEPAQPGDRLAIRVTGLPPDAHPSVEIGGILVPADSVQPEDSSGVYDVLVTLPPGVSPGDAVPVSLRLPLASGATVGSNVVTMAVEPVRR